MSQGNTRANRPGQAPLQKWTETDRDDEGLAVVCGLALRGTNQCHDACERR